MSIVLSCRSAAGETPRWWTVGVQNQNPFQAGVPHGVLSVNVGVARSIAAKSGLTGIDKRATSHAVTITVPPAGGSGLAGDAICDTKSHGGPDQAVYAYAREDLDAWQVDLGREIRSGSFGENLTTIGIDVTGARIGERWRIGSDCVLQVTCPRVPCRTFAVWLDHQSWVRTFTARAMPGAYLRVLVPGDVSAGDDIVVEHRPDNDVTIALVFRALTSHPELLPDLLVSPDLTEDVRERALRRQPIRLDD
ncbi:MAG: MOSC domain-containing protein [Acidobacteria bacterium]|nr:MOSC domain-containing protein [Acidobacteriota bacterium]